jgi:hypothetical protein
VPFLPFVLAACNDAGKGGSSAKAPEGTRSEVLDHEACADQGPNVQSLDTNGDGKPDLRRVYDRAPGDPGAREVCRVVDLNHDGRPDIYEYLDAGGAIRRREFCYDETGIVNAIEMYRSGKLTERVYDTTGQHKIDTWDWFDPDAPVDAKTGRPTHPLRRERDLHGDGTIDQWWTWSAGGLRIETDRNGDGKPDPESVIVLGGDGGSLDPAAAGTSPSAAAPGAVPPADGGSPTGPPPPPGEASAADSGLVDGAPS